MAGAPQTGPAVDYLISWFGKWEDQLPIEEMSYYKGCADQTFRQMGRPAAANEQLRVQIQILRQHVCHLGSIAAHV